MIATRVVDRLRGRLAVGDDSGLTLIEVIVALVVFSLFSMALVGALIEIKTTSRNSRMRVTAANLAQQTIEQLRDAPTAQIPLGQTIIPTSQTTVNGLVFTVTQNVQYVQDGSQTSSCDSGANSSTPAYKRITEIVTWPNMGTTTPVRADTLKTVNVNGLDPTKGSLSVKVTGQGSSGASTPQAGVTVTATPASGAAQSIVTGEDGCAVFTGLAPGTVTAQVSQTGYVSVLGAATAQTTATITAATLSKNSITYAQAATAIFAPSTTTTTQLPLSLSVYNSAFTPSTTLGFVSCSASPTTTPCVTGTGAQQSLALYPSPSDQAWFGTCADADPSSYGSQYATQRVTPPLQPGLSSTVQALSVGTVTVQNTGTTSGTFYLKHLTGTGCTSGEVYSLGTLAVNAKLTVDLPYGAWVFSRNSSTSTGAGTSDGSVSLSPATPNPTTIVSAK